MARKKKAELVEEAEALGVDAEGLRVPELEVAVVAAEQAATAATHSPHASGGRHAAHARGTRQGVHLQLGHIVEDADGVMVFQLASEFILGSEEALVLAEELGHASADHSRDLNHTG